MSRRTAYIYIDAPPCDIQAARGLVGKTLRESLGIRKWRENPHFVVYRSVQQSIKDGVPRESTRPLYNVDLTNDEMQIFGAALVRNAQREGWTGPPVDIYHD